MVRIIKNKGSAGIIWILMITLSFVLLSSVIIDVFNVYKANKHIKESINLAVKAASLQVEENGDNIANGVFKIDEKQALNTFLDILVENLNIDRTTLEPKKNSFLKKKIKIKEFVVINETPCTFTSSTIKNSYQVDNPSVYVVIEFTTKTLFIKNTITYSKLSASQLTSIYK